MQPLVKKYNDLCFPSRRTRKKFVFRGLTMLFISMLITAWIVKPQENDDWYERYKPYIWTIETEGSYDYRTPIPSQRQRAKARQAKIDNNTETIIVDLSESIAVLADAGLNTGLPMLERLANFSKGLGDISRNSFLSSSRIYRYGERMWSDTKFKDDLPYLGILF